MKEAYTVRYRQPGQLFWRTIKNVKGDEIVYARVEMAQDGSMTHVARDPLFRAFHCEDDSIHYIALDAEVVFPAERQAVITFKMSKEAGVPVQRA